MIVEDARAAVAASAANPVDPLYDTRAKELMSIALGVGITSDQSRTLVAARLAEWDAPAKEARTMVARLFTYLDVVEESDSGREFHPVTFGCCRAMWNEDLERIMAGLKAWGGEKDVTQGAPDQGVT